MSGPKASENRALPQMAIIMLLVVGMVLLHHFAQGPDRGFDPTTMLALGFIVLASYTIGGLLEYAKLPHITGYLIAGLLFGPSVAVLVSQLGHVPAPFDRGVLNPTVISQLSLLDTLAVALIALTAGGELKLDALRKGLRAILGIAAFQFVFVMSAVTAFVVAISGVFDAVSLPALTELPLGAVLALGVMVASIAFATSPAATIAVINETGAKGPMSRTVLSTVVLKDVVVVLTFAIAQVFAAGILGGGAMEGGLLGYITQHILLSIVVGVTVGAVISGYLRFFGQELLLFVVAVVFVTDFVAKEFHWDMVLIFLAAGFVVSNFSKTGPLLIETVERLSLPVYVVFFTLAGAKLHLEHLIEVWWLALGLAGVRALAVWSGVRLGGRVGRADEATKSVGWLGFLSQAGVSISLAAILAKNFGEPGKALETVIIGGVALNEILGPVCFKLGLGLAGETSQGTPSSSESPGRVSIKPPEVKGDDKAAKLKPWPEHIGSKDLWGEPLEIKSPELKARTNDLGAELQALVRNVSTGPLRDFRTEAEHYLRDLRREFLRRHRRLSVQARAADAQRESLATMLRTAQFELAAHFRGIVLGRSITLTKTTWSPDALVQDLEVLVESLPESIDAPYEEVTFQPQAKESVLQTLERGWLRVTRKITQALDQRGPVRHVPMKSLARFHLSSAAPTKLEGLAALFVEADRHLAARTRSLFDGVAAGYHRIGTTVLDPEADVEAQLAALRTDIEEELALALDEVRRISREGTHRAASALAEGFVAIKAELPVFATLDLPASRRRSSKLFAGRTQAIKTLQEDFAHLRRASAAGYALLAMELELLGLEAHLTDVVEEHAARLEDIVERRALEQARRVSDSLDEGLAKVELAIAGGHTGEELSTTLRTATEPASRMTGEASKVTAQLYEELSDELNTEPLLDALLEASRGLTPRYRILSGQQQRGEWRLPTAMPEVEVPFREVVLTYVESRIAPTLLEALRELAQQIRPLSSLLQELERQIAFNVELATAELEVVHDEPVPEEMHGLLREMVAGQLERTQDALKAYLQSAAEWAPKASQTIRDVPAHELGELRTALATGTFSESRLQAMRRAVTKQRVFQKQPADRDRSRAHTRFERVLGAVVGHRHLERWRVRFGRVKPVPADELSADIFEAPKVSSDLPLVYRRLFAADAMEAGDVLTGREREIQRAERLLSDDAPGRLRSVALVSVDGVGKAAVANAIVRTGRWKNVRRVVFEQPATLDDVDAVFSDAPDNQLVVVDGLSWLLSMEPGGFEPLRHFVSGVISERGKRRWLTHADVLFWNFGATVAPLADAFPEVLRLEPLDPLELQAAVMARHRLSGYGHAFDRADGESGRQGFIARGANRLRGPFDRYFDELHEATGGLVRDALRLWLASIREIQDGQVVRVGPVPPAYYLRLKQLPDAVLLSLYQVARQGWLNAAGQARLFRADVNTAQAQLSRLAHLGLLTEHEGTFRIAVHLRGPLMRIFTERGWVQ